MRAKQSNLPSGYLGFLAGLKEHIANARILAAFAVNSELILLYWHMARIF